ncbi:Rv3235 family protein [Prauserella muralis]|uniref:Uncharacterized protein n=1 Tax=Prauserella muralis TaxID=588067 RepID=A0A2V4AM58_9PSEU|nr:Rv3235 family protein [Prauserella muralis]PXY21074.1 hypothetical protein BAY60_26760 [Prauserella muralis]TWE30154.1 hypothetical protein FHX69_2851 [Prauserella muralis]
MHTLTPGTGLLPLTPYEPARHGHPLPARETTAGQLTLDDLLAEIPPRHKAGQALPVLERRTLHKVLTALLEVHAGRRPVAQLGRWLTPALHRTLRDRCRTPGQRYTLRRVYSSRPADGAIEACGIAHTGERAFAVTARFEHRAGRWSCTYFGVLEPSGRRA